ncbi:MAG TPA: ABC transporter permease subunit, partial [Desulfosporosinus sp.]|nr:ABC transporter permease subunit [Desulfosporosinus sp.]
METINSIAFKVLPKTILYTALFSVLLPLGVLLIWSFAGSWPWPNLLPKTFSLRVLGELFGGYSGALQVLFSSMLISMAVALASILISIPAARAVAFYDLWGKDLIQFITLLPVIVPVTAFAMGTQILFIRLNLSDTVLGVMIVHIILCLPYTLRILTEVTKATGNKMESQARVLGATSFQTFRYITLPLLMPGIIAAGSMAYIISFSQYFLTFLVGGGNIITFSMFMFPYIQSGDRTISSGYSILFIATSLLVFILFETLMKKYYHVE